MAKAKGRTKGPALASVPQTRDAAEAAMARIGALSRELEAVETAMNRKIAAAKEYAEGQAAPRREELAVLSAGLTAWAEANRAVLTNDGKVKTAYLGTGVILWRLGKRSVRVKGAEAVIAALKRVGLARFVRVKEEVDKEACLRDPAAVAGIQGLTVTEPVEEIVIEPHREELAEALQ